jgi:hypothetical protein
VTLPENVEAIHSMILDDRKISVEEIAGTIAISRERVRYIIHEVLDTRKLSTKWFLKCLKAGQKRDGVLASQTILDRPRRDPVGVFNETWIHIYNMIQRRRTI